MLRNNNKNAVRRISSGMLRANRTRNIFSILAVVLTTFLIATVFSIGVSFAENYLIMVNRRSGTSASVFLHKPTERQIKEIQKQKDVKAAGTQIFAGTLSQKDARGREIPAELYCYNKTEFEQHLTPAISEIKGSYPKQEHEVMLSTRLLNQLGIEKPERGMKIPLTYQYDGTEPVSKTFRLSGWYQDHHVSDSNGIILLSGAYCRQEGFTLEQDGLLAISVGMGKQAAVMERLQEEIPLNDGQKFISSYDISKEASSGIMMAATAIIIVCLFIVFSGYLLIYNILYISVAKDIRFYGLLKTIGTSPAQIRKIVRNQMLTLSLVGIPAGLALSALASFQMVPLAMSFFDGINVSNVSFHPIIFLGAALFSLFTIVVSCRKPAKTAGSVSPIEALKYSEITGAGKMKKARRSKKGGRLYRMALYNIFRDKKRAVLVFLSLFMGTITFLSVNSFVRSLDADNYLAAYYPDDFSYDISPPFEESPFDDAFIQGLREVDGIKNMQLVHSSNVQLGFDEKTLSPVLKYAYDYYMNPAEGSYKDFADGMRELAEQGEYSTSIFTIPEKLVKQYNQNNPEHPIDIEAFRRGDIIILGDGGYDAYPEMLGRELALTDTDTGNQLTGKIGGIFHGSDCGYSRFSAVVGIPEGIYVSEAWMEKLNPDAKVTYIFIQAEDGHEPAVKSALKTLNQQLPDTGYDFSARTDIKKDFQSMMATLTLLGTSICTLLLLIAIINFINVMLTGIFSRRHELAVMESVGMTKKQILQMLCLEGAYYALITVLLILTIGSAILALLSGMFVNIADYAVFRYPFGLMAALIAVICIICTTVPVIVYHFSSKSSVTERLSEGAE